MSRPRKTPIKSALKFPAGVPNAPPHLDAAARDEYSRIVELLAAVPDHLQAVDLGVVATYAQAWADVCRIAPVVRSEGEVLVNAVKGTSYINPRLSALSQARNAMFEAAKRLGFSPVDRARAGTRPAGSGSAPSSPLMGFLARPE